MKFKILNRGLESNGKIRNYLTIKGLFGFKILNPQNIRRNYKAKKVIE